MKDLILEVERKVKTKEDLIFFIEQIDLAHDLILKNLEKDALQTLKGKINSVVFSVLKKIEKETQELERKKVEKEKRELLAKEKEASEKLKQILENEKNLEEKLKKLEEKEEKAKGTEKEKEIEKERWVLEEERIKVEKQKWQLKDLIQKIKEDLEKIKTIKTEKDPNKLLSFLETIRANLLSLPQVELQIAFEPSREFISQISEWFEKNLGKKFILDFKIKPKIVGGAIIEYNGRVADFSIIKEIKKELHGNYFKI